MHIIADVLRTVYDPRSGGERVRKKQREKKKLKAPSPNGRRESARVELFPGSPVVTAARVAGPDVNPCCFETVQPLNIEYSKLWQGWSFVLIVQG